MIDFIIHHQKANASFLDNRPLSGIVTYVVVAVDFHDNRTEVATISVNHP